MAQFTPNRWLLETVGLLGLSEVYPRLQLPDINHNHHQSVRNLLTSMSTCPSNDIAKFQFQPQTNPVGLETPDITDIWHRLSSLFTCSILQWGGGKNRTRSWGARATSHSALSKTYSNVTVVDLWLFTGCRHRNAREGLAQMEYGVPECNGHTAWLGDEHRWNTFKSHGNQ